MKKLFSFLLSLLILVSCQTVPKSEISSTDKTDYTVVSYTQLVDKLINGESFLLVYGQTGCSSCSEYLPILTEFVTEYSQDIFFIYHDNLSNEQLSELSTYYISVEYTPTTYVVFNGYAIGKIEGLINLEELKEFASEYFIYE